jgi:hypothetical protein
MTNETYFRIQAADRDVTELLDPEHVSYSWDNEEVFDLGTSTCATLEDLAAYIAQTGIPFGLGEWVVVEVAGENVRRGRDGHMGEWLVQVTEIVSIRPLDDAFYALIDAAYEALNA